MEIRMYNIHPQNFMQNFKIKKFKNPKWASLHLYSNISTPTLQMVKKGHYTNNE